MTDSENPQPSSAAARARRASFAGIADIFSASRASGSGSPPSSFPGPISHAAAAAQQRRLSITTLGLSTSPGAQTPATPFSALRSRQQSVSSSAGSASGSVSLDESPFEDGDASPPNAAGPFARRVSFGARAMRDMRSGSGGSAGGGAGAGAGAGAGGGGGGGFNANGRPSVIHTTASDRPKPVNSPPAVKGREGFSFAENMRARAERGSISAATGVPGGLGAAGAASSAGAGAHARAKSVAVMEPPIREMPAQPRKPDQFQERILKGDFYMD